MSQVDGLLREMITQGASDLHLVVGRPPLYRLRGDLVETPNPPLTPDSAKSLIYSLLSQDQQAVVQKNLDLDFAYQLPDGAARFRANVLWQHRGLGAVMRIIPTKIMTVEQLGLPPVVKKIAEMQRGLVLV